MLRQKMGNIKRGVMRGIASVPFFPKQYYCSACGKKSVLFFSYGVKSKIASEKHIIGEGKRKRVFCMFCLANDRMRWIDYVIEHMTDLYTAENTVLHIAPEKCVEMKMRKNNKCKYTTGDICAGIADSVVDITDMKFKNETFDYIILNMVLEHVQNEDKALTEIHRCLKNGGKFFFSIPICLDMYTYEKDEKLNSKEKLKEYGQKDHCRLYGKDVVEHIEKYGFRITEYKINDYLKESDIQKYHLLTGDRVYIGEKV